MEMMVGSAIVVAVLAWMVLTRIRRARQQPHARWSKSYRAVRKRCAAP
jgi:hypothetical protein